jgi:formylmethanofuran dehydrogenase subunit E
MSRIGPYTFEQYCEKVKEFHGSLAPGILIGGFMITRAMSELPPGILFDAISETVECLPDAIQLLTPCTIGNQWLKIIDAGRFAAALYDKYSGDGVRVYLDLSRLENFPAIKEWLLKLKPKKQQDSGLLLAQIQEAGAAVCNLAKIKVSVDYLRGNKAKTVFICPVCREAFKATDGDICPACGKGLLPYKARVPL